MNLQELYKKNKIVHPKEAIPALQLDLELQDSVGLLLDVAKVEIITKWLHELSELKDTITVMERLTASSLLARLFHRASTSNSSAGVEAIFENFGPSFLHSLCALLEAATIEINKVLLTNITVLQKLKIKDLCEIIHDFLKVINIGESFKYQGVPAGTNGEQSVQSIERFRQMAIPRLLQIVLLINDVEDDTQHFLPPCILANDLLDRFAENLPSNSKLLELAIQTDRENIVNAVSRLRELNLLDALKLRPVAADIIFTAQQVLKKPGTVMLFENEEQIENFRRTISKMSVSKKRSTHMERFHAAALLCQLLRRAHEKGSNVTRYLTHLKALDNPSAMNEEVVYSYSYADSLCRLIYKATARTHRAGEDDLQEICSYIFEFLKGIDVSRTFTYEATSSLVPTEDFIESRAMFGTRAVDVLLRVIFLINNVCEDYLCHVLPCCTFAAEILKNLLEDYPENCRAFASALGTSYALDLAHVHQRSGNEKMRHFITEIFKKYNETALLQASSTPSAASTSTIFAAATAVTTATTSAEPATASGGTSSIDPLSNVTNTIGAGTSRRTSKRKKNDNSRALAADIGSEDYNTPDAFALVAAPSEEEKTSMPLTKRQRRGNPTVFESEHYATERSRGNSKEALFANQVSKFLAERHLKIMVHDRKVPGGETQERPDFFFNFIKYGMMVEKDEDQHPFSKYKREMARLNDIWNSFLRLPLGVLRFNGDAYVDSDGIAHPSCYDMKNGFWFDKHEADFKNRCWVLVNYLEAMFKKAEEFGPESGLHIKHFFYDGCDAPEPHTLSSKIEDSNAAPGTEALPILDLEKLLQTAAEDPLTPPTKPREKLIWTTKMKASFEEAHNKLQPTGKATAKRILQAMGAAGAGLELLQVDDYLKGHRQTMGIAAQPKEASVWTTEREAAFVEAHNKLEPSGKATPKRILQEMGDVGAGLELVKRRIQKHKLGVGSNVAAQPKETVWTTERKTALVKAYNELQPTGKATAKRILQAMGAAGAGLNGSQVSSYLQKHKPGVGSNVGAQDIDG